MQALSTLERSRVESPSASSSQPDAVSPPPRLTRRGRVVVVLLLLLAVFLLVSLAARGAASEAGTAPAVAATRYVTVQPGQTLWDIARQVAPAQDVRDAVDRIRELNALSTTVLQAGQRLVVPA